MYVSLKTNNELIFPNNLIDISSLIGASKTNNFYQLTEASPEELEGEAVIIKAESYFINKKEYPLGNKHGLAAIIHDNKITPLLRRAVGKEISIFKKNNLPNNEYWPLILPLKEANKTNTVSTFVVESLDQIFSLNDLNEETTFDIEQEDEYENE